MKVKLLRQSRIKHEVGEIVNVSPSEAEFLMSVGSAVKVTEEETATKSIKPEVKKEAPKAKKTKTAKKETKK